MDSRRRTLTLAASVLVSIAILVVGTRPRMPDALRRVPDWTTHGSAYAVVAFLASRSATVLGVTPAAPWAAGYAIAHGCLLELLQMLVPTRTAEVRDVAADAVGAAIGVAIAAGRKSR
jgi:VanZ family protein